MSFKRILITNIEQDKEQIMFYSYKDLVVIKVLNVRRILDYDDILSIKEINIPIYLYKKEKFVSLSLNEFLEANKNLKELFTWKHFSIEKYKELFKKEDLIYGLSIPVFNTVITNNISFKNLINNSTNIFKEQLNKEILNNLKFDRVNFSSTGKSIIIAKGSIRGYIPLYFVKDPQNFISFLRSNVIDIDFSKLNKTDGWYKITTKVLVEGLNEVKYFLKDSIEFKKQ